MSRPAASIRPLSTRSSTRSRGLEADLVTLPFLEPAAPLNPFPGLRPFEPDEDYLFFGRERQTDQLLKKLRTTRFLSILGRSGSGKSSLVRSGLIPSLDRKSTSLNSSHVL